MARIKKKPYNDLSMPSLFDDLITGSQGTEHMPLPGLERHIQNAREEYRRRHTPIVEPLQLIPAAEKVIFISFGSGAGGNCTFIGTRTAGVLIDAGVDNNKVESELQRIGISMEAVKGILLTHDHGDHIRYSYSLLRRHRHLALYCTPRALNGILRRHNISRRIKDYHHPIYKEMPFQLAGWEITAFEVDHDGSDNAGFFFSHGDIRFTLATDLGNIGQRVDHYMRQSTHLMIESNYDYNMLRTGRYPEYLKARIMASNGHMDNAETAAYLASIYTPALKYIFLCHLSNDNNRPEIATETVKQALQGVNVTVGDCSNTPASSASMVQLMALPRFDSTGPIVI